MTRLTRIVSRTILVGGALLLFLGAALFVANAFLPPVYFAKVTMEVKPDISGATTCFSGTPRQREAQFIAAVIRVMQSEEVLREVIDNLKLVEEWSTETKRMTVRDTFKQLEGMLEFRQINANGLSEIGVYARDPVEAANIANTFAVVYQHKRLVDFQTYLDRGLEQLKDEVEKQRQRAEDEAVEMAKIRERLHLVDPDPTDYGALFTNQTGSISTPEEKQAASEYIEAKTRYLQAKRTHEAAQTKYATELIERRESAGIAKIWEKAGPPVRPLGCSYAHFRHAFTR